MRLRHIKNSETLIYESSYVINNDDFKYNESNTYLELGMGKGSFIIENANKYRDINYIGIEKSATIIMKAIENLNDSIKKTNYDFNNLKFMCMDINHIEDYFKESSINKIFINFSDPWPKKRHENRRLTHIDYLNKYHKILNKNSFIEFKTDNKDLFDFSLEEIKKSSFKLIDYTYDLHNDDNLSKDNIMTEYEKKFTAKNIPICKLILKKLD